VNCQATTCVLQFKIFYGSHSPFLEQILKITKISKDLHVKELVVMNEHQTSEIPDTDLLLLTNIFAGTQFSVMLESELHKRNIKND
jgi:hypothetical protein